MKDIVFLGPSLDLETARSVFAADYRPPVRMGDVFRAVAEQPRTITIIDGVFERIPAVWHKEILFALSRGIPVYGASSMGALRAAELAPFGMIGIGAIYRDFAEGVLFDDDEVAVAHGSAETGYLCTSVAMVTLRRALAAAAGAGILSALETDKLIAASKARFYPERTWEALFADALAEGIDSSRIGELRDWVERERPDQKRADAIEALRLVSATRATQPRVDFEFEHTVYWETVETYCSSHNAAGTARFEQLRNHVRIFEPDRDRIVDGALLLLLAKQEARRLKLPLPDNRSALQAFRARRGLESAAALAAWMAEHAVSKEECLELARTEALLAQVRDRHIVAIDHHLIPLLKMQNRFGRVVQKISAKWDAVAEMQIDQIAERDVSAFSDVLNWYQQRHGRIAGTLEHHALGLGIGSAHQLRQELFAEYLAEAQLV